MKKRILSLCLVMFAVGACAYPPPGSYAGGFANRNFAAGAAYSGPTSYDPGYSQSAYNGPSVMQGRPIPPKQVRVEHAPSSSSKHRCLYQGEGALPPDRDGFNSWCD